MDIKVTVITPAYNAASYIEKCVQSVLHQTVPCKMIIVDDCSTDKTLEIVKSYAKMNPQQICVIENEKNAGVAESRNQAVAKADTEYIAFLDADDWWSEDKIEKQLDIMLETKVDVCYSGRELMSPEGNAIGRIVHVPEETSYKCLLKGNVIPCSSVLMKHENALAYPMLHDELHEDYIVWLTMLRDGKKFVGIDMPLLKSRLGEGGKSRNKWKSAKMTYGVYRLMGIPTWKAIYYFGCYACAGITKYVGT